MPWRSRVHALVASEHGHGVLLVPLDGRWRLPCVEIDGFAVNDVRPVARALAELLGERPTMLRYLAPREDAAEERLDVTYVLESLETDAPTGGTWAPREMLEAVPFAEPAQRELALEHLDALENPAPTPQRAPWAYEGWLEEASGWIATELGRLGRPPTGPPEQLRTWCLSSVLRVPTAGGAAFFKATAGSPLFVDEGRVMTGLARLFPNDVPRPLAFDSERRWMLLDEFGPGLGWDAAFEIRGAVLRRFAEMQIESSRHLQELVTMGCIDRRPGWLADQVDALVTDDAALSGLEPDEVVRLRSLAPRLRELCRRLGDGPLPNALVHGDLHLSNVAQRGDGYLYFDWTDASVSNPLLELFGVLREENERIQAALLEIYLSAWVETGSGSYATLLELWRISEPLIALNQAVSYRYIVANVERDSVDNLDQWLTRFLRRVIETDFEPISRS